MMKKIILLALLLGSLAAQAYEPMIREDRVWEYYFIVSRWGICTNYLYTLKFDGTQEVNGKTYHQLKMKSSLCWTSMQDEITDIYEPETLDSLQALLREEDSKVYMLVQTPVIKVYEDKGDDFKEQPVGENEEVVIFDFSRNQPEECFFASGNPMHGDQPQEEVYDFPMITKYSVEDVSETDGMSKQYTLRNCAVSDFCNNKGPETHVYVAEGIGNVGRGSFLVPETEARYHVVPNATYGEGFFNNLYDLEGNVVYKGENVQKPSSGIESVGAAPKESDKLYDLTGREIRNPQRGTIYIQDGEKRIAW